MLFAQTPQLHVEGETRIDPLSGSGNRPVFADPLGNLVIGSMQGNTISLDDYTSLKLRTPADSMIVLSCCSNFFVFLYCN